MSQPGSFANGIPAGEDWVPRAIRDLQREVQQLRAERSIESTSIGQGGIEVTGGSINVIDGDLTVAGGGVAKSGNFASGTDGWQLSGDGNLEVNDITLRGGIIGNDALSSAVLIEVDEQLENFVAPTTDGMHTFASLTFVVPDGFTQAAIICSAWVMVSTGNGSPSSVEYLTVLSVDGVSSPGFDLGALPAAGRSARLAGSDATKLTGLVPSYAVVCSLGAAVSLHGGTAGSGIAYINAQVTWLR